MAKSLTQHGQPTNYNVTPATRSDGDAGAFEVDSSGNLKVVLSTGDIALGQVELKDSDSTAQANIKAANTARTTATVVIATQNIDAAGNVIGIDAANTARTTATKVLPVQSVDAAGAVLSTSALATSAKQDTLFTELQLKADLTETQPVSIATAPVLVAGTALIGKVGIDQVTANANEVVLKASIAAIGKLAANSGVDIGDVDVTSAIITSGTITTVSTVTNLAQINGFAPPGNATGGLRVHVYAAASSQTDAIAPTIIGNYVNNETGLFSFPYVFNGTTWDRARNNVEATVFSSAARTATANSTDQVNYDAHGIKMHLDITASSGTTPTLDIKLQALINGVYIDIAGAVFTQKTGTGTDELTVYPGIAETANESVSDVIPRTWRAVATIAGSSPSFTFSLGVSYIK